jgi:hypothetical protein
MLQARETTKKTKNRRRPTTAKRKEKQQQTTTAAASKWKDRSRYSKHNKLQANWKAIEEEGDA